MTSWNDVVTAGSGIYLVAQTHDIRQPEGRAGECVWQIDGRECTTRDALFAEFSKQLRFPDYFGKNWDAFDECISSLEWLPCQSHFILIKHAESLLKLGRDLSVLLKILQSSAGEWTEVYPGGTFKVALVLSEREQPTLMDAFRQAGVVSRET